MVTKTCILQQSSLLFQTHDLIGLPYVLLENMSILFMTNKMSSENAKKAKMSIFDLNKFSFIQSTPFQRDFE